ncbi:hypothetical protein F5Y10DRAFT_108604 [Nemania abortiva]|nr:hypothetical protein F5Y10DRAFT_108604 [Nemania abortiva]
MVAARDLSVIEAMESPSASNDGAPLIMLGAGIPRSSDSSSLDLANRSDPPNPPDLSDRRSSPLRPTPPTLQPVERDDDLMTSSDTGLENTGGVDVVVTVVDDHQDTPPRLDKGKAPERVFLQFDPEPRPSTKSYEGASTNVQQARNPTELVMGDGRLETPVDPIEAGATEEDSEGSAAATDSESQDASYPSSVFEEADDYDSAATSSLTGMSWKQKQKQKADPEAETKSLSETSEGEEPFRPLSPGDPGWEKSTGRPPQKLPIRFRDAVGRNFLFPWDKAKTWAGMKKLVENCFKYIEVLGPHVLAGRYDLSVNLPFSMDPTNEEPPLAPSPAPVIAHASTSAAGASSSYPAGFSSMPGPSSSSSSFQQQEKSSFVVLPELWEDTIEPGMVIVQHMWPFQTPTFVPQPAQPTVSPPPPMSHPLIGGHGYPVGRGRGTRGRGRGGSTGAFGGRGGIGGNSFGTLPHPGAPMPRIINVVKVSRPRGKTRRRL